MNLADKKYCCGCGGCSTVCPFGAIKMQHDEEYFLYPVMDEELCKNCGKCEKVCPVLNKSSIAINSHNTRIVQGFYKDVDKHKSSASGGAATAFAEAVINAGGCVFGSAYTDDYEKAIYVCIDSIHELDKLKGSKYIETSKGDIFERVYEELITGRKVLFTGLPCDVAGLKCYLKKEYSNLYTCELICHGPTSQKVQKDYISHLSNKYGSLVKGFSSRHKKEGTEAPYIRVEFENGKIFEKPLWDTEYGYAFALYNRESCHNCSFKGDDRVADISVGDSWSAKENYGNKMGVSIMYAHTDKGIELLEAIEEVGDFELQELDYEQVKEDNPAIRKSIPVRPERNRFAEEFKKTNLRKATLYSKKLKDKFKYLIKKIIS